MYVLIDIPDEMYYRIKANTRVVDSNCLYSIIKDGIICSKKYYNRFKKNINKKFDNVDNPQHYTDTTIEPIEVIEDWDLDFCLGNAIKYIKRAGHKKSSSMSIKEKELNDLKKAAWYINRKIYEKENDIGVDENKS